MRAFERKLCRVVVERLDARPGVLAVAALARYTEPALVRIDRLMTIDASAGHAAELGGGCVTPAAGDRGVSALQREIGKVVIERLTIELDDVRAAPLVIGVTVFALLLHRVGLASVITPARQAIRRDLLMAGETQIALRLTGKRHVALRAIIFQLGMAFDQRPGCHELFN